MRAPRQIYNSGSDGAWATPLAQAAVAASVRLPGSKSMTNRGLVLAAVAQTPTTITGPLRARDTDLMIRAVVALGGTVEPGPADAPGSAGADDVTAWTVTPGHVSGSASVDVGNAGTVLRFVPPIAALNAADVEFT